MTRLQFTASIVALIGLPFFSGSAQAQRFGRHSDGAAIAGGILNGIGNILGSAGRPNQGNQGDGNYRRAPNTSGFQNQNGFASGNDFFGDNDNWSGNNWNNNNWSSGYQRPSVTYYRPNPTYTTPTYTAPSSVYSGGQVSYSAGVSYASPQVLNDPPVARLPIELEVPKSEFGICNYQLLTPSGRAYDYSITPGQKQKFSDTTRWKIRYDQGQAQGVKTYDLRGGKSYELRKNDAGLWQLYMKS